MRRFRKVEENKALKFRNAITGDMIECDPQLNTSDMLTLQSIDKCKDVVLHVVGDNREVNDVALVTNSGERLEDCIGRKGFPDKKFFPEEISVVKLPSRRVPLVEKVIFSQILSGEEMDCESLTLTTCDELDSSTILQCENALLAALGKSKKNGHSVIFMNAETRKLLGRPQIIISEAKI